MRRQLLYGSYSDRSRVSGQTGASVMRERVRNILVAVLILVIVALGVTGGRAIAYRSSARGLFVSTLQTECDTALGHCSTLSRTGGANSSAMLGRIRASVYAMDMANQYNGILEGGRRLVPDDRFTALYDILDQYANRLLTGMNTGDMQGELQAALEELQTLVAAL